MLRGGAAPLGWQRAIADAIRKGGVDVAAYVPDARLRGIVAALEECELPVRALTREEECVAYAVGYAAAGGRPVVLMQCSGLGNSLNALGSFAIPYGIGIPLVLSMRGTLGETNPSQVPMGRATVPLLQALAIQSFAVLTEADAGPTTAGVLTLAYDAGTCAAVILEPRSEANVKPSEAVHAVVAAASDDLFVSSLGTATSALRLASDDGPHLYLGGAMGCGRAAALGVAERCPHRGVVAVVGDGDLLMGAGSLWSLSGLRPTNLLLVLLDDGRYSITGGQDLVAPTAFAPVLGAFPGLAADEATTPDEVEEAVRTLSRPGVVVARIDESAWPGPSPFVDPHRVRARFLDAARGAS